MRDSMSFKYKRIFTIVIDSMGIGEMADAANFDDADLFVLPEMFSTGFCTKPEGVAESADSETLRVAGRASRVCRRHCVGSFVQGWGRKRTRSACGCCLCF